MNNLTQTGLLNLSRGRAFMRIVAMWWLPLVLVILWWVATENLNSFFFPPLSKIMFVLWRDLTVGPLFSYLLVSLSNMAIGLSIAAVLGVSMGLVIGEFKTLHIATGPTLNFLRAVPPAAIVPLVIVAMGIGSAPKIFIIALACFWPMLLNTIEGVRSVPQQMIETVRAFKIPLGLKMRRVLFMAALPQIMAGFRIALSVALVLMVISEFFGASEGVGFYIREKKESFAMAETWGGTVLIGIIGYVLSSIFMYVERIVLGWYFQISPTNKISEQF